MIKLSQTVASDNLTAYIGKVLINPRALWIEQQVALVCTLRCGQIVRSSRLTLNKSP